VNFTSIFMSVCFSPEQNLASRLQTPTLIGCILLKITRKILHLAQTPLRSAKP
jgi:hypothetical protein